MGKDYFTGIWKARREWINKQLEFEDILDKWEEEHEDMGIFTIGLNFQDKKEVYIKFHGNFDNDCVNMNVVDKACEDFDLRLMHKYIDINYQAKNVTTRFILRHKTQPYGL